MILNDIYNKTEAVCLAHGYVGNIIGKSVNGLIIHGNLFNIVGLIDHKQAGNDTRNICLGVTKKIPIVSSLREALKFSPKVVILLGDPEDNYDEICYAIENKLDIINSSFSFLSDFESLVQLSKENKNRLIDLRKVNRIFPETNGEKILNIKSKVILVSGTDCGIGKRTAAYELAKTAKNNGIRAAFLATGQTGLMLGCDQGIVLDAVPGNFLSNAIEYLITELDNTNNYDIIFVEGQGSILHYVTSASISLLHSSNPHAIVLAQDTKRKTHKGFNPVPILKMNSLEEEISVIKSLSLAEGNKLEVIAITTIGNDNISTIKSLQKKNKINSNITIEDVMTPNGSANILKSILKHLNKNFGCSFNINNKTAQWENL